MKALAVSYKGMEDITSLEIKELIGKESEIKESCVVFDCSKEELALLCYKGQAVNRVLLLLNEFKINSIEDLKKEIDISEYGKSFAVRTEIVDSKLDTKEVEIAAAEKIEGTVDLDNPDVTVFVYIYQDNAYFGIDFGGELSKREYKIVTCRTDLKGTIAYALVRLSGYSSEKSFLNLNAKGGTIAIEAALFGSGLSVNYFNKQKFPFLKFLDIDLNKFDKDKKDVKVYADDSPGYLNAVKKNAKVAGVDIKFEQIKTDCVVKLDKGVVEVKNLEKEREIKHGGEVLKIVTQRKH